MDLDKQELDDFGRWLADFGLSEGTIRLYRYDVESAFARGGPVKRLKDRNLAPKTLRHILAACRRWARFRRDQDMLDAVERIRLPAPRRQTAKVPITRDQLFEVVAEINRCEYLEDPMKASLGLMAIRGFRCGDVTRLKRREIDLALENGILAYEAKGRRRLEFKVLDTYRYYLEVLAIEAEHVKWTRVEDLLAPTAASATRRQAANRAAARALRRIGLEVGIEGLYPHQLRRTYATEYLAALGPDPFAAIKLQQHMQWASLATAMGYVDHDRGQELDDVAEKMWERR